MAVNHLHQITELLKSYIDPKVKTGIDISNKDELMTVYFKVENIKIPIVAKMITNKKEKEKLARQLLKEAFKEVSNKSSLKKLSKEYLGVLEENVMADVEDEFADTRNVETVSYSDVKEPTEKDFDYDEGSAYRFIPTGDIADAFNKS